MSYVHIISRDEWGARPPREQQRRNLPVAKVVIHHSQVDNQSVRTIQNYHMDQRKDDKGKNWVDIGYNFLVDEDGTIYEGRGWHLVGAHAVKANQSGVGICLMGNFQGRPAPEEQVSAAKALIRYGVENNFIQQNYKLQGHRDVVKDRDCPGNSLYQQIQSWPRYSKE